MSTSTARLVLLASALLAISGSLATAAEFEPATNEAEAPGGSAEAKTDRSASENAVTDDNPPESHDVFLPTEEISEDFAVPFPVDI